MLHEPSYAHLRDHDELEEENMKEIAWAIIAILQVLEHLLEGTKQDAKAFSAEVTDHKTALLRKYGYEPIPEETGDPAGVTTRMSNGGV